MNIIKVPLRIPLGGGGTDLPEWYTKNGSFFLSASINKYIYLTISTRPFDKKIWLSYSDVELCDNYSEVKHKLFNSVLDLFAEKFNQYSNGIEIHSISEVPGKSGLGSSGSFTVGLIYLLNNFINGDLLRQDIAEMACDIEMNKLKNGSGKQDQYIAAYGGIRLFSIDKSGEVKTELLDIENEESILFKNNLLIYYSGITRDASSILLEQQSSIVSKESTKIAMSEIQAIGIESAKHLKTKNFDDYGKLMNKHWEVKKSISTKMSDGPLNELYDYALQNGAVGGKVMGAGGGGFFLFYVPLKNQEKFRLAMKRIDKKELLWNFENNGVNHVSSF